METNTKQVAGEILKNLHELPDQSSFGMQAERRAQEFADGLLATLFPHFSSDANHSENEIFASLVTLEQDLRRLITPFLKGKDRDADAVAAGFIEALPDIQCALWLDAEAINIGDPAAESVDEVILAYPGFTAIAIYRFAHELYRVRVPILPRLLTEYAHQLTGIDIHPGAQIGSSFAIDHGTGIVIGESTIIGNNVKLYQGVTLGALSVDKNMAKSKRHPTVQDNVVIYAQAVILGGETVVGHDSMIGGNVWLTHSVPPFSVVYQKSETIVQQQDDRSGVINFVI